MTGHTDNTILIRTDIDSAWRITNDLHRWTELFTEYAAVEVLEHRDRTWRFRLTMHPDAQGNAWSWISERRLDPDNYRVTARRIEPGWFEYMDIAWSYEQTPEGTLMRWVQDFRMRPDSPVDDAAMTTRIDTNSKVQMAHVRDEVERVVRATATSRPHARAALQPTK
jgi:aromatase